MYATTTYPAIVGKVIGELRRQRGLTQADLAAAVGLRQPAWSKVERGETAATVEQLAIVAERLEVAPAGILVQADAVALSARERGITVKRQRAQRGSQDAIALIGAAALGALVGTILSRDRE